MAARMCQHKAFIEKRHFRIGDLQNADVNGANRRPEYAHETARGEIKWVPAQAKRTKPAGHFLAM
jgi:hypothetical protein